MYQQSGELGSNMERIVLDYLDFGSLPSRKWWTIEITGFSRLAA